MQTITALVFNDYETLDLFGPVEIFGNLKEHYRLQFASISGSLISNHHNVELNTIPVAKLPFSTDILLIVGGSGTRQLVEDTVFLKRLADLADSASWVLSVCTGSALLAKAGILDGKRATSNKRAWQWVIEQSDQVHWLHQARWVIDGKFYTSSGVSAGIDMALGFIANQHTLKTSQDIAQAIEYRWQPDSQIDEFCHSN